MAKSRARKEKRISDAVDRLASHVPFGHALVSCDGIALLDAASDRIVALEAFARDVRDNYDCDEDAHRYGYADTQCRCCMATALIAGKEADSE